LLVRRQLPIVQEHLPKEKGSGTNSSWASALEPLKSIGGAAGVLTGLAFINGWLYWATYYTAFGMNSLVLNLPFAVVAVSPVQVLVRDLWTETYLVRAVLILAMAASIAMSVLFVHWYKHGHPGATAVLWVTVLGASAGAWLLGLHDAGLDAGCNSRLPAINFELIKPPDQADVPPPCIVDTRATCHLILHFNNTYRYFVAPDPDFCSAASSSPGAGRPTYEMSDSQIRRADIVTYIGW
jgi:hypothetical protein